MAYCLGAVWEMGLLSEDDRQAEWEDGAAVFDAGAGKREFMVK